MKLDIRRLAIVSRPFWWVNTGVPFLAGALLADNNLSPAHVIGFIYFLVIYNLLMYGVNDIYDYESDIKNPRKNGSIDGSVLDKKLHSRLWVIMLALNVTFLAYFVWIGSAVSSLFLLAMVFLVFAYSVKGLRFKERPVLDSLTSAFHYASPFLFGLLLLGEIGEWWGVFIGFYLWVCGNHAFGAIQDIVPDKKAGISSIATKLGPQATLFFVISMYVFAAASFPVVYGAVGLLGSIAVAPYLLFALKCLPDRNRSISPRFRRYWRYFLYANYAVGALGTMTAALYLAIIR